MTKRAGVKTERARVGALILRIYLVCLRARSSRFHYALEAKLFSNFFARSSSAFFRAR